VLSLPEAAAELAVSQSTIRRWIKTGDLPARKVGLGGGRFRISRDDLDRFSTEEP
jgi:excisionase family DNA binding protein